MRLLVLLCILPLLSNAQTNITVTSDAARQVLLGNYDPALYAAAQPLPFVPSEAGAMLQDAISADSLRAYILRLADFGTRNTGSDTVSGVTGIGAARRWVHERFAAWGAAQGGRLLPAYLQFDQDICGMGQHRNIMAVLPGMGPTAGIVIVEGHMDSRCAETCDVTCTAEGVEDNATGTALVMELARVLSPYRFANTIVFCVTIGEEQGLLGANALATYCQDEGIPIRAVLNNDVIGGIYCGATSSAPSCPGLDHVDSTSVRLFSSGNFNSKHKQLARYIKLQYQENLLPSVTVPMNIRIMSPEDRTGRGGDHIPFRQKGFAAMRFTSANEHGDASNGPTYSDRQHTSDDILGVDTDGDGAVDSFFVDFNYLQRNALINANATAMIARNVAPCPDFTAIRSGSNLLLSLNSGLDTFTIRVALRSTTNDWDTVFQVSGSTWSLPCPPTGSLLVSVAGVDYWGVESLFSVEKIIQTSATEEPVEAQKNIRLLQNRPNPFDEATWISFWVELLPAKPIRKAEILVQDVGGRVVERLPVSPKQGLNEVLYTHGYGVRGTFSYSLYLDGVLVDTRQMVYAN
jgi:hypothetical protein